MPTCALYVQDRTVSHQIQARRHSHRIRFVLFAENHLVPHEFHSLAWIGSIIIPWKINGRTSLTFNPKYRKSFAPLVDEVEFIPFGDKDALQNAVNDKTAMVIMEPIQGESGIHVAPRWFSAKSTKRMR